MKCAGCSIECDGHIKVAKILSMDPWKVEKYPICSATCARKILFGGEEDGLNNEEWKEN